MVPEDIGAIEDYYLSTYVACSCGPYCRLKQVVDNKVPIFALTIK